MKTINNTMYQISQETMIGKIEYLNDLYEVVDYTEYEDEKTFIQDIKDELEWCVDIRITLYRDSNGNTIANDFIEDIEYLVHGINIEDAPVMVAL